MHVDERAQAVYTSAPFTSVTCRATGRCAPASRFPCFPVLLNNEEEMVNLDLEANVCPLLQDRMQRCEEEGWQGNLPGVPYV